MITVKSNISPIKVSGNGRYFLDRKGKPFFLFGDTQWHLYRNFSPADARKLLLNRKKKGFNTLLVMVTRYTEDMEPNINGDLPWKDASTLEPNEKYFEHMDKIMNIACELDFVQVAGIYHMKQDRLYGRGKARSWARWLAKRYRNVPHIIWSMYPQANRKFVPVVRELAAGLREGDGGKHMITVHPDPSPQSSSFIHGEKWLSFNSLQPWRDIELVYPMTAADFALTPVKPVVMAEGGYEGTEFGTTLNALDMRRQAYWTYLAGGWHVYGNSGNWLAPEKWKEWADSEGSLNLGVFKKVITSLPGWWDIVPDQSIFMGNTAGSGKVLNAAARSAKANWALAYLSSRCTAMLRIDRVKASKRIKLSWINPLDGRKTRIAVLPYSEAFKKEYSTPEGWEDALLLMEAV